MELVCCGCCVTCQSRRCQCVGNFLPSIKACTCSDECMNSATDLKGGDDVVDDNDEGVDEQIGTGLSISCCISCCKVLKFSISLAYLEFFATVRNTSQSYRENVLLNNRIKRSYQESQRNLFRTYFFLLFLLSVNLV